MITIDSNGWIEYFTSDSLADEYASYIQQTEQIITPSIVLYEVFKVVLLAGDERAAVEAVAQIQKTSISPLTSEIAIAAAEYSVEHKLPMADAIVYATAMSTGARVITSDAHFEGLPFVEYIPKQP